MAKQAHSTSEPRALGMIGWSAATLLFFVVVAIVAALQVPPRAADAPVEMTYADAIVLGIVEGITEYLPVSSTGHLLLTNRALGLDSDLPGWPAAMDAPAGPPVRELADAYIIAIQGGAILAVLIAYWGRVRGLAVGVLRRDEVAWTLALKLGLAFLPAAVIGLLLGDWIEKHLFGSTVIAVALIAGAVVMVGAEWWHRRREHPLETLEELPWRGALLIGFLQCIAMIPGTSRSMITIVGGYLAGLKPVAAAEFSFLLGLITLTAASGYKLLGSGMDMLTAWGWGPLLTGLVVATVTAFASIYLLLGLLVRYGLGPFAWYRVALGLLVLLVFGL